MELIHLIQYLNNDCRYKPKAVNSDNQALTPGEDLTSDYMNILGMILSMCGLLMKVKLIYISCDFSHKSLNFNNF